MPNAAMDQAWRIASGNAYPGNPIIATAPPSGTITVGFAATSPGAAYIATSPGVNFTGN